MSDTIFTEDAGRFLNRKQLRTMSATHQREQVACGQKEDEVIRSEFFGKQKIAELLRQPNCVGLRIHYAKRWEDDNDKETAEGKGKLKARVVLTGVDAQGRDIINPVGRAGAKDEGDGDTVVGDGYSCPRHCPAGQ